MEVRILQELKPYSIYELENELGLNEEDLNNALKTLSMMNIVRKLSIDTSKTELEELLEIDNLEDLSIKLDGKMYLFKFVGMLVVGNTCLIVYPKYQNNYEEDKNNNFKILKQLILVIRKYKSKQQNVGVNDSIDIDSFNILSLALELISNYHENGLYRNDREIIELNGEGEILWNKTINENQAIFSNGVPIYLDTYTLNQENNETDYFRRLHATVITEICKKLEDVLKIIDIDSINISSESISNFGSNEFIIYRLNQELSTQFVTYKQNILNTIKKYIEQDMSKSNSNSISFVGTNSFNLVWEDVCSKVMGDCIDKPIKDLGLKYSENTKDSALVSDIIEKPKWKHNDSGNIYKAKGTLIPDIITIKDNKLSIYDAKYYRIRLDEYGVDRQPGISDVTKQYLYELAFKRFAEENNLTIDGNAFLMPIDSAFEKKLGVVSMDIFNMFGNIKFNDIEVILKPCEEMYDRYLNS